MIKMADQKNQDFDDRINRLAESVTVRTVGGVFRASGTVDGIEVDLGTVEMEKKDPVSAFYRFRKYLVNGPPDSAEYARHAVTGHMFKQPIDYHPLFENPDKQ